MQASVNPRICSLCGGKGSKFRCPCRRVYYCSKECQCNAWPEHRESCIVHLEKELSNLDGEAGLPRAVMHTNLATQYHHVGNYEEGKRNFNRALEICTGLGRDGDMHIPAIMIRFGDMHVDNDRYEDALRMYFTAFNVCERTQNGSLLLQACEGMAKVFGNAGDTALARVLMDQVHAEVTQWTSGEDHPVVLRCLIQMEKAYYDTGNLIKGRELLVRARDMVDRMGDFSGALDAKSTILSRTSVYHFHMQEYDRAMEAQKAVLSIDRGLYGENHHNVAGALYMTGVISCAQCNFEEALPCLTKALKIQCRLFGKRHAAVAATMASLAGVYGVRDKDYARALKMFGEAVEIIEANHGPDYYGLENIYRNMGSMKAAMGDGEGARACEAEAHRVGSLNTRRCARAAVPM